MDTAPHPGAVARTLPLGVAGIGGAALLATFFGTWLFGIEFFRNPSVPLAGIGLLTYEARRLTRHRRLGVAIEILGTVMVASAAVIWLAAR